MRRRLVRVSAPRSGFAGLRFPPNVTRWRVRRGPDSVPPLFDGPTARSSVRDSPSSVRAAAGPGGCRGVVAVRAQRRRAVGVGALLGAAPTAEVTTEQVYLALITPPGNPGDHSAGLPS
jgi:hypothetical protein